MGSALLVLLPVAIFAGSLFCGWNLWALVRDLRRDRPIANVHHLRGTKNQNTSKWINASVAIAVSAAFAGSALVLGVVAWDGWRDIREWPRGSGVQAPYCDSFDGPSWKLTNTPAPLYRAVGGRGHPVIGANFSGGAFTDGDLVRLACENPDLEWLHLVRTSVTDKGLEALRGLEHVCALALVDARIGDSGFRDISTMKSLRSLHLYDIRIGDCGWESLSRVQELRELRLAKIAISDQGIVSLLKLRGLENLSLIECDISDDAAVKLQQAMSQCEIIP